MSDVIHMSDCSLEAVSLRRNLSTLIIKIESNTPDQLIEYIRSAAGGEPITRLEIEIGTKHGKRWLVQTLVYGNEDDPTSHCG